MKLNVRRVIAFFLLIALSVGFGFAFDAVVTAIEKHNHPLDARYQTEMEKNAKDFGIPESILWSIVRSESNFVSNHVSDTGEVGLMQISPEQFAYICINLLGEPEMSAGMLYDPATNLRAGTAWISELYGRYGVWETVYAAYYAGTDMVDAWLRDPELVSAQGRLQNIPDSDTADYVKKTAKSAMLYQKLYYN